MQILIRPKTEFIINTIKAKLLSNEYYYQSTKNGKSHLGAYKIWSYQFIILSFTKRTTPHDESTLTHVELFFYVYNPFISIFFNFIENESVFKYDLIQSK